LKANFWFALGEELSFIFHFLEYGGIPKFFFDLKTNVFVFRTFGIFFIFFFVNFVWSQGYLDINNKKKKLLARDKNIPTCGGCLRYLGGA
jgi:hypothetical protein